ncbi:hypothetical protein [Kitasatospora sp. SUK 42]|uniref:hypothetical protein n=1 Tax=Kitasatospora sp. SUK 42 TaxID=1588882 RepID=UPI0018CB6C73|nr:hypothetical protein [Kitasatospora sp. SUK 42]MBV2153002.1 hypothetical protein [Kitasatospora sp. SUK 42]
MKSAGKIPLVGLALAAGLVIVTLGVVARWPVWLWVVPAVVAVVLAAVLASARAPRAMSDEPPWERTRVVGVALPSLVPDYDFHFSATVWWRPVPNATGLVHADPAGLAVETVLERARAVTEREVPGRLDLLQHRLNGVLGTQSQDRSRLVEAMGGRVELGLSEDDRRRLGKLSEVRKTEEVWEHERRHEQNKRAYLGDDVLKSPGSAVVWWLARNDDRITEAVDLIGPLAQLSAAANDEAVSELYEHLVFGAGPFPDDDGDEGDDGDAAGPVGPGEPGGPYGPDAGPPVVGPLKRMLADAELEGDSPAGQVYVHRVADAIHAAGRPEQARLIREKLLGDGEPAPDRQPSTDGSGVRFTKFNGAVNGFAVNGTSPGPED